ncbi:MAG: hypothetical protein VX385_05545, partial [Acidobacteriota bacterium]|nr:hypothetical protein [Acidobacteriota bacterium]
DGLAPASTVHLGWERRPRVDEAIGSRWLRADDGGHQDRDERERGAAQHTEPAGNPAIIPGQRRG